jgi:hypothetical protein
MEVKIQGALDLSEGSKISISLERWPDSSLESVDDAYQPTGLAIESIGFTFTVPKQDGQWRRADHSLHESPCSNA